VERLLGEALLVEGSLGDVAVVEYQAVDGGVVEQVGDGHLEPLRRGLAVTRQHAHLADHRIVGITLDLGSLEQSLGGLAVVGVDELQVRAADQLLRGMSEYLLDGWALVADQAVGADHREDVRGVVDERTEALLALAKGFSAASRSSTSWTRRW
jgi:hypothetical protein